MMFGWSIVAAMCDSRTKRSRNCSSQASSFVSTLSATLRREPNLLRDVDDAHAAAAEDRFDPEPGDFRSDPRRSAQLMRARRHGSSESRRTVGWKVRQAVHQYRTH